MQHKETDLGVHFEQIAGANVAERLRVLRIQPKRIFVRDLVEKFRIPRSRVNQMRQTEDGKQRKHLAVRIFRPLHQRHVLRVEVFPGFPQRRRLRRAMNVAAIVFRQRKLRPLPIRHGFRKQLQFPRRRIVANNRFSIDHHAYRFTIFLDHAIRLDVRSGEIGRRNRLLIQPVDVGSHFVSAILAHVFQRLQTFFGSGGGQARH